MGVIDYLRKNIRDWHETINMDTLSKERDGSSLAGDTGEDFVKRILGHRNFSKGGGGLLLSNKRIPIHGQGKREIDFIVITQRKIHIIEVKNWSGRIVGRLDDERWIKQSGHSVSNSGPFLSGDDGSSRFQKNIIFDNIDKAKSLSQFFERIGYDISVDSIEHKVFFVDSTRSDGSVRLEMDESIRSCPHVITSEKLGYYLDVEQANNSCNVKVFTRVALQLIEAIVDYVLNDDSGGRIVDGLLQRVGKEKHRLLLEDCKCLPTWDQVKLLGGDIVRGDVMGHYGDHNTNWEQMFVDPSSVDIARIGLINNSITERNCRDFAGKGKALLRSMVMGNMPLVLHKSLKEQIFGMHVGLEKIPAYIARGNVDYRLSVKPAGNPDISYVNMPSITEIKYGNRQAHLPWLFNNVFPRHNRYSSNNRKR